MKGLAFFLIAFMFVIGAWAEGPVTIDGELSVESIYNQTDLGYIKIENDLTVGLFDIITLTLEPYYERGFETYNELGLYAELAAEYKIGIFGFGSSIESTDSIVWSDADDWVQDGQLFDTIQSWLDIETGPLHFDVDFVFSLVEGEDAFQGAEFSGLYTFGPAEIRAGYLLTDVGMDKINAPDSLEKGGVFGSFALTY